MGRSPCCDKNGVKKGPWTSEEDQKLLDYIKLHGPGNWRTLPKNAGLQRCGKSCRLRWANYLRPDIKRGRFSFEEEETIIQLHSVLGNKWSAIAHHLPGRTDNEIKNYWNTHIRKRLLRNGIDPVTHTPRLDFQDVSNILNLLNPNMLKLASVLSSIKQEHIQQNQLQSLFQLLQPNYQFQNPIISKLDATPVLNQEQPLQQQQESKIDLDDGFSWKDMMKNLEPSNLPPLSENLMTGFESSPNYTPLGSTSTFLNTEEDQGSDYSSSFKFEIPESFNIGDFL